MTQPAIDYDLDAAISGSTFRTETNVIIESILTKNAGTSDPPVTFPFMDKADTTDSVVELLIRNAANSSFIKWAELDGDDLTLFSLGGEVPSVAAENTWTAAQEILQSALAGTLTVGSSSLSAGVITQIFAQAKNSAGEDTTYGQLTFTIEDATDGSEDGFWQFEAVLAGAMTQLIRFDGGFTTVNGTFEADTLQQDGTDLDDIIEEAISGIGKDEFSSSIAIPSANATAGDMNTFTGTTATVTINSGTADKIFPFLNDGSGNVTFAAGAGVTIAGNAGLTLGAGKMCSVYYRTATRVFIKGENA